MADFHYLNFVKKYLSLITALLVFLYSHAQEEYLNNKKYGYVIASFLFGATPLPSNFLFITYGLMRAKSFGIYIGFWFGRVISYIIMIYFGNAVLTPFLEIFEDRLTGILIIDAVGIGIIVLFASVNWTVLITQKKLKFVKPKIWRF